jgi:hypothetical protein
MIWHALYPPCGGGDTLAIWRRQGKAAGISASMFSSLIQRDAGPESPAKTIPLIEHERRRF